MIIFYYFEIWKCLTTKFVYIEESLKKGFTVSQYYTFVYDWVNFEIICILIFGGKDIRSACSQFKQLKLLA